jgi:hypothetical protein
MLESVIADPETAKRISELMLRITAELNESVRMAEGNLPPDEFSKYRRSVGAIMAEILEVLNPLYSLHPGLKPPGFE